MGASYRVCSFNGLGFLWYSPLLAGKAWAKATKIKSREGGDAVAMVIAVFLSLLSAFVLGLFETAASGFLDGLLIGLAIGIGLVDPTIIIMYFFSVASYASSNR